MLVLVELADGSASSVQSAVTQQDVPAGRCLARVGKALRDRRPEGERERERARRSASLSADLLANWIRWPDEPMSRLERACEARQSAPTSGATRRQWWPLEERPALSLQAARGHASLQAMGRLTHSSLQMLRLLGRCWRRRCRPGASGRGVRLLCARSACARRAARTASERGRRANFPRLRAQIGQNSLP